MYYDLQQLFFEYKQNKKLPLTFTASLLVSINLSFSRFPLWNYPKPTRRTRNKMQMSCSMNLENKEKPKHNINGRATKNSGSQAGVWEDVKRRCSFSSTISERDGRTYLSKKKKICEFTTILWWCHQVKGERFGGGSLSTPKVALRSRGSRAERQTTQHQMLRKHSVSEAVVAEPLCLIISSVVLILFGLCGENAKEFMWANLEARRQCLLPQNNGLAPPLCELWTNTWHRMNVPNLKTEIKKEPVQTLYKII